MFAGWGSGWGGSPGNRGLALLGWTLVLLALGSLGVAIANTAYTYINYNDERDTCPDGDIINMCPVKFVYISSGIWGSIPVFGAGLLAIRLNGNPMIVRLFFALAVASLLVFTPAMMVINAIEIVAENKVHYTINSDGVTGDITKFILPLVVAILAAIEFLILALMVCYIFMNRGSVGGFGGYGGGAVVPFDGGYGGGFGGFGFGGGYDGGFGGYGGWGGIGDDFLGGGWDDGGYFDDGLYGGGYGGGPPVTNNILMGGGGSGGGGGGAGGAGGAGGSAAASAGGGGTGSSSNNNNNNLIVPPIIVPPSGGGSSAPSYPMPFPMFMPGFGGGGGGAGNSPVVVTTNTTPAGPTVFGPNTPYGPVITGGGGGQAPAPQPMIVPGQPPMPRPVLLPAPPTRYYPQQGPGPFYGGF